MTHILEVPQIPNVKAIPFDQLAVDLMGVVITPAHADYEAARGVWNAAVNARPAAVVSPHDAKGVALAVHFAREHHLPIAVRSGGHSPAGFGTMDGGLVIDLSNLKSMHVDVARRVARIESGLTWGEVAEALHPHGLALTSGDTATVGVGGLTLGGGIGWMVRKHGLALDRLRAVELVSAEGALLRASATEHSELFWALRGGGGNVGIATAFEFDVHDGGTVLGGAVFYDASDATRTAEMLRVYAEYALSAPDDLSTQAIIIAAPPAPFVPQDIVGTPLLGILVCHAGDLTEGERVLAPLRALGTPVADLVGPMPYPAIFGLAEVGTVRGLRHYSRSMFLSTFSEADADALVRAALATVNPGSLVQLRALGGAISRVPSDATAFAHRDKNFMLLVSNFSPDPSDANRCQAASDAVWRAVCHRDLGMYGNFVSAVEEGRAHDVYPAATFARLAEIKRRYDPHNVLSRNVNIQD